METCTWVACLHSTDSSRDSPPLCPPVPSLIWEAATLGGIFRLVGYHQQLSSVSPPQPWTLDTPLSVHVLPLPGFLLLRFFCFSRKSCRNYTCRLVFPGSLGPNLQSPISLLAAFVIRAVIPLCACEMIAFAVPSLIFRRQHLRCYEFSCGWLNSASQRCLDFSLKVFFFFFFNGLPPLRNPNPST